MLDQKSKLLDDESFTTYEKKKRAEESERSLSSSAAIVIWDFDAHQLPRSKYEYSRDILMRYRESLISQLKDNPSLPNQELLRIERYIEKLK